MAVGLGVIPQFPASISTSDASILVSVANGIFDFKVNPAGIISTAQVKFHAADIIGFTLDPRTAVSTLPVPTFRPTTLNTCIALDLMPNGNSPADPFGSDLITWIDLCDKDLYQTTSVPYTLFSIRNRTSQLELGSRTGNGASAKPITVVMDTTEVLRVTPGGALQMGGTNTVLDANRLYNARSYTVAGLPTPGTVGRVAYASNGRAYNGAGTLEGAGAGTGVLVIDNGTIWKVAGTNQSVQA
jgi:hypothetical protein